MIKNEKEKKMIQTQEQMKKEAQFDSNQNR